MSRQTTNYGYNISEGTDLVNPLVDIFPNWESLDSDLKDVSDDAVGRATELTTGTVHALTRSDTDRDVFVFTATSNFTAGDTFTLDGTQVSALTPAGEQLATGCYIIGSDVLVAVHETLLTMYVSPTKVADSDKLDGHDSTYFATASDLSDLSDDLNAISDKVGTGTLTTDAQNCVGAINELNSDLSNICTDSVNGRTYIKLMRGDVTSDNGGSVYFNGKKNGSTVQLDTTNCRMIIPVMSASQYQSLSSAFINSSNVWRSYIYQSSTLERLLNTSTTILYLAWLIDDDIESPS